jgi:hypothetical protein
MLILVRRDKAGRVDDPWDIGLQGSLRWTFDGPRDVSAPAKSQVIGISACGLLDILLGGCCSHSKKKIKHSNIDEFHY